MRRPLQLVSLLPQGPRPYREVLALQQEAEARVKAGGPETLFLLEHRDVITIGRNTDRGDLFTSEAALARLGVELVATDRGGKLTFHGPGQLVAYPVLGLAGPERDVRWYTRGLEEVLVLSARDFGVEAERSPARERWSSVWVGNDKLGAIGIHLSEWVTTHGVALNVSTDLSRFSLFTPCGITDGGVTSIAKARPDRPAPEVREVAARFVHHFGAVFGRTPEPPSV